MYNYRVVTSRGFSLIELLMVIVIIGAVLAVTLPFMRKQTDKTSARGAADAVTALHSVARMAAIQRGRTAKLVMPSGTNKALVVATKVTSTGLDTLGKVLDLAGQFGVALTSTSDTISFSPRGIGTLASAVTIIITKGTFADTLTVSRGGRLSR